MIYCPVCFNSSRVKVQINRGKALIRDRAYFVFKKQLNLLNKTFLQKETITEGILKLTRPFELTRRPLFLYRGIRLWATKTEKGPGRYIELLLKNNNLSWLQVIFPTYIQLQVIITSNLNGDYLFSNINEQTQTFNLSCILAIPFFLLFPRCGGCTIFNNFCLLLILTIFSPFSVWYSGYSSNEPWGIHKADSVLISLSVGRNKWKWRPAIFVYWFLYLFVYFSRLLSFSLLPTNWERSSGY